MHDKTLFIDLNNPNHCYMLGYFWADCCFCYSKKSKGWSFSFEIKTDDFLNVWDILNNMGFEKFTTRKRKNTINAQSCVRKYRTADMQFFHYYNFHNKLNGCNLFFDLDDNMKINFMKGFLDGDGSISVDKNGLFRVGFNGHKDQSWDFVECFCKLHNIEYAIYRKDRTSKHESHVKKIHGYSVFEFTTLQARVDLCKILQQCKLGLGRKLQIYENFKNDRIEGCRHSKFLKKLNF
jgi:hypothetical protein